VLPLLKLLHHCLAAAHSVHSLAAMNVSLAPADLGHVRAIYRQWRAHRVTRSLLQLLAATTVASEQSTTATSSSSSASFGNSAMSDADSVRQRSRHLLTLHTAALAILHLFVTLPAAWLERVCNDDAGANDGGTVSKHAGGSALGGGSNSGTGLGSGSHHGAGAGISGVLPFKAPCVELRELGGLPIVLGAWPAEAIISEVAMVLPALAPVRTRQQQRQQQQNQSQQQRPTVAAANKPSAAPSDSESLSEGDDDDEDDEDDESHDEEHPVPSLRASGAGGIPKRPSIVPKIRMPLAGASSTSASSASSASASSSSSSSMPLRSARASAYVPLSARGSGGANGSGGALAFYADLHSARSPGAASPAALSARGPDHAMNMGPGMGPGMNTGVGLGMGSSRGGGAPLASARGSGRRSNSVMIGAGAGLGGILLRYALCLICIHQ
jgi:hypothetical protein